MPLLTCPNDNAAMQTVQRSGVELDICPQCRGVWLDRGELEKLLGMARAEQEDAAPPRAAPLQHQQPPPRQDYGHGERGERGEYGERGEHGYGRRKKRFDIFDVFD